MSIEAIPAAKIASNNSPSARVVAGRTATTLVRSATRPPGRDVSERSSSLRLSR